MVTDIHWSELSRVEETRSISVRARADFPNEGLHVNEGTEINADVVEILDLEDDLDTGMHRVNVCKGIVVGPIDVF